MISFFFSSFFLSFFFLFAFLLTWGRHGSENFKNWTPHSFQLISNIKLSLQAVRSYLSQLRYGILPIEREVGRNRQKPLADRLCPFCASEIKDEKHFIFSSSQYEDDGKVFEQPRKQKVLLKIPYCYISWWIWSLLGVLLNLYLVPLKDMKFWLPCKIFGDTLWGRWEWIRLIVGFQPLMVESWIRWCMQVNAWWFNVDLSCLGWTIYARQFLGAEPPIEFRHRSSERNHSDHLYWRRAAQSVAKLTNAKRQAEKRKSPSFYIFGVTRSGIEPRPPPPRAGGLVTTRLRGSGALGAVSGWVIPSWEKNGWEREEKGRKWKKQGMTW